MIDKNIKDLETIQIGYKERKIKRYPGQSLRVEISIQDIQKYIIMRFGSMSAFARSIGYSRSQVRLMLIGQRIPKQVWAIERLAKGLGIHQVVLTKLLEKIRIEGPSATIILNG